MKKILLGIMTLCLVASDGYCEASTQLQDGVQGKEFLGERACIQEGGNSSNNNLELKNGYEFGPPDKNASIAFNLANGFIQHEKDLKRFLITQPATYGKSELVYDVHYKLLTKSEEGEAVVRVNIEKRSCKRIQ